MTTSHAPESSPEPRLVGDALVQISNPPFSKVLREGGSPATGTWEATERALDAALHHDIVVDILLARGMHDAVLRRGKA